MVDYFEALTTARPYHRAMGRDEAIGVLCSEAGRVLDPHSVPRFIRLLPTLDLQDTHHAETGAGSVTRASCPITGFSSETQPGARVANVFENISRATQEIHAFYDIAQTLGTRLSVNDSMALLTSKLTPLVPASCWALHLYEPEAIGHADFCSRYAGDEFVVVLSRCRRDEAEARALQIQASVDAMITEVRPGLRLSTAISIGVAVSPEDGDTYDELLAAADRRMYEDKERRRRFAEGTDAPLERRSSSSDLRRFSASSQPPPGSDYAASGAGSAADSEASSSSTSAGANGVAYM